MEQAILRVDKISKEYPGEGGGIKHVSFELKRGEICAVIGGSGSGKSTLLKCIYGTLKLDAGEIFFNGTKVKGPDEQLIPGHASMRMVAQDFNLNIYANVYDNIGSMISNKNVKTKHEAIVRLLEQLHILPLQGKRIIELSGGEQQRVAIARALATDATLLLLDEPFSQIDTILKSQLRLDLKGIAKKFGVSIMLVSHDPMDGLTMADQLIVLEKGSVIQSGSPQTVYNTPAHVQVAKLLGHANLLSPNQAIELGFVVQNHLVVYPEWIVEDLDHSLYTFQIEEVAFKGFVEELTIRRAELSLNMVNYQLNKFRKGDLINISILKSVGL